MIKGIRRTEIQICFLLVKPCNEHHILTLTFLQMYRHSSSSKNNYNKFNRIYTITNIIPIRYNVNNSTSYLRIYVSSHFKLLAINKHNT